VKIKLKEVTRSLAQLFYFVAGYLNTVGLITLNKRITNYELGVYLYSHLCVLVDNKDLFGCICGKLSLWKKMNISMKVCQRLVIYFFCSICIPVGMRGQSVSVGDPVLEDYYRRTQLMGKIDSSFSFMVRPFFPSSNGLDLYGRPENGIRNNGKFLFDKGRGYVQLLPITWIQQYNSDHPEGWNDGAMIPAAGNQTFITGGLFAKYGHFTVQFKPEYVNAENKAFKGLPATIPNRNSDQVWYEYYEMMNFIDLPERFGEDRYKRFFWGQSSIRFNYGAFSLGFSNENLWWGPGVRNSLLMSNTAPGFAHLTLNTVKPVRTKIGSFEGQIICGHLNNSGFYPPDTVRTFMGNRIYIPKRDDWRYINGMVLSYQPKWVPGLFLGFTRSFTNYNKDKGDRLRDYLPILYPMEKVNKYGDEVGKMAKDQHESVFIRWLWLREMGEIYWEFGRQDHAYNARDLMLQLEYTRAYIFGIRKLFPLVAHPDQFIQFNLELTQLEQTGTNPERPSRYLYTNRVVTQGYTHEGQMLGPGIGPGSNLQSASVSWVKSLKKVGLQLERYVHNNDFHNIAIKDIRANWVDLSLAGFADWNYKNFLISARFEAERCYNYEHLYEPLPTSQPEFWDPGRNTYNFQTKVALSYYF